MTAKLPPGLTNRSFRFPAPQLRSQWKPNILHDQLFD